MSLAADIEAVLSHLYPDVKVQATAEKDGTRIVVQIGGQTHWFSVGQGQSALLNYLLTGYAVATPPSGPSVAVGRFSREGPPV